MLQTVQSKCSPVLWPGSSSLTPLARGYQTEWGNPFYVAFLSNSTHTEVSMHSGGIPMMHYYYETFPSPNG